MFIPDSLTNCRQKTQEELDAEMLIMNQRIKLRDQYKALSIEIEELEELEGNSANQKKLNVLEAREQISWKLIY